MISVNPQDQRHPRSISTYTDVKTSLGASEIMEMDWQRAFTNTLARLILAYGLAALAFGQTPAPKQEPSTQPNLPALAKPATTSQTTPAHLAGVEADNIVRWTLKDAIMAALEKNPDIEIARHNVRLSQFDVLAAQGAYDPITSSTLNYNSQKTTIITRVIAHFILGGCASRLFVAQRRAEFRQAF